MTPALHPDAAGERVRWSHHDEYQMTTSCGRCRQLVPSVLPEHWD